MQLIWDDGNIQQDDEGTTDDDDEKPDFQKVYIFFLVNLQSQPATVQNASKPSLPCIIQCKYDIFMFKMPI